MFFVLVPYAAIYAPFIIIKIMYMYLIIFLTARLTTPPSFHDTVYLFLYSDVHITCTYIYQLSLLYSFFQFFFSSPPPRSLLSTSKQKKTFFLLPKTSNKKNQFISQLNVCVRTHVRIRTHGRTDYEQKIIIYMHITGK